ncbi:MAG TPA: DUF1207 domain-containing protein, partial [bacterium]
PREAQSYLIAQLNSDRFDGSIAATLEFLQLIQKDGTRWGWGVEGDTFIEVESPGYSSNSLVSNDYFLIFPEKVSDWYLGTYFSESSGDFSNRFEYVHVSSHLGDGVFTTTQGFVYTRESLRFTTSFHPSDQFRLYAGVGYYPHIDPEEPRFFFHVGTELYTDSFSFIFGTLGCGYFTYDLKALQEAGGVLNQNFEVGFQWKWKKESHQAMRLAIVYYNGNNVYGQFYQQKDEHWSFGLFFDP